MESIATRQALRRGAKSAARFQILGEHRQLRGPSKVPNPPQLLATPHLVYGVTFPKKRIEKPAFAKLMDLAFGERESGEVWIRLDLLEGSSLRSASRPGPASKGPVKQVRVNLPDFEACGSEDGGQDLLVGAVDNAMSLSTEATSNLCLLTVRMVEIVGGQMRRQVVRKFCSTYLDPGSATDEDGRASYTRGRGPLGPMCGIGEESAQSYLLEGMCHGSCRDQDTGIVCSCSLEGSERRVQFGITNKWSNDVTKATRQSQTMWPGHCALALSGGGTAGARAVSESESGPPAFSPSVSASNKDAEPQAISREDKTRALGRKTSRLVQLQWPAIRLRPLTLVLPLSPPLSHIISLSLSSPFLHRDAPPSTTFGTFLPMATTFVAVHPAPAPRQSAQPSSKSTPEPGKLKPPRPCNSWILFRSDMLKKLPPREDGRARTQAEISTLVSDMWANVSPRERASYEAKADRAKAEHTKQFPGYTYQPNRGEKKEKVKRKLDGVQERAESAPKRRRKTPPHSEAGPAPAGPRGPTPPTFSASSRVSPEQMPRLFSVEAGPSRIQESSQLHAPSMPSSLQLPHRAQPLFPSLSSDLEWRLQTATETSYSPPQNASQVQCIFAGATGSCACVESESEAFAHDSLTALLGAPGDGSVFQAPFNADSQDFGFSGPDRRRRMPPMGAPQQGNAEAGPSRALTETVDVPPQQVLQNVQFEFPADPAPAVQTDDEYITELLALVPNPPLDFDRDWQSAQQEVDRLYSPRVPSEDADELRYPVLQLYL
ncbi:hypothetical protein EVG20_g5199 [Dentipellis fragilis]|uniref:HMG box domain-containing protein n=1 Tax=Dentipellis fragilis TaxID=205917 RepID=A0A4Y9YVW9_9AGAM|nr:hypothetical protein EVG20_g5199 [Dentipellis fragilis]